MKKIPDLTSQLVSAMREDSNKWNFIVRILKQEKDAIDWNVHEKKDDQGKELTAKQIYELITWWQFLDYVINLPETILNESRPKPKQKEPDFFLDMAKTTLLSYAPKVQEWGDCRDIYMKIKDGKFEELTVLQFGALLSIIDTLKPMDFFIEGSKEAALNAYVKIKDEVYRLRVLSVSVSQSIMTEVQKEFGIEPPKQKAK